MSCQGVVKNFNDGKGWGFILYQGQDVFVHIKDCQASKPCTNDAVKFDLDAEKAAQGKMKAINVTGGTGSLDAVKGQGKGQGFGPGGCTSGKGGSCQGKVKSFSMEKQWGFIEYQGQDLFCHAKECVDGKTPQKNDFLNFDVEESKVKPGSFQAKNIAGGSGWPVAMNMGQAKGINGGGWGDMGGGWGKSYGKGSYGPAWGGGDAWGMSAGPYGGAWGGKGGGWGGKGKGKW